MASPATKSAPKRLTGTKVGKYTLKELVGQGGYGDVYVAEQKNGANVAVKLLDPSHARDDRRRGTRDPGGHRRVGRRQVDVGPTARRTAAAGARCSA